MAAAAYKAAIKVVNDAGQTRSIPVTATDVNAAAWVFPSGGTELQLSSVGCTVADIVYTAAGTDTSQVQVYINGIDSGLRIYNGANLGTTYDRQIKTCPIRIPAGALVKFVQLT
jgi:hypothetical protein